jgi:hypothetical protein
MWEKLLGLLSNSEDENYIAPSIAKREARQQELASQASDVSEIPKMGKEGKSALIGYNYLKGLDGDYEDSSKQLRRFINLNRLLRGKYSGKIETTSGEPESDLRGEDSE